MTDSPTEDSPLPIREIADALSLDGDSIECFGRHAGKLSLDFHKRLSQRPAGRYVGVTAVSPTPFGEGKTVVAIGLAMGLSRLNHRTIVSLREPSLSPVFGIKGGGAGGGRARVLPTEDINLHFTGDSHAVAAANNLLAAMVDNHAKRGASPRIDPATITWRRVIDVNDKGLARIECALDNPRQAFKRETGFDLTAASEVMSILALASDLPDLRRRLGQIVVAHTMGNEPVTAEQIGAAGAMAVLLRDAIRPNLVQTSERTPAFVHAGPFGNISHGNSSVVADLSAVRLADFVVTESGFGADLGAEKFFDIKCRVSGLKPDAEVLVCTVRALKHQSGRFLVRPGRPLPPELLAEDLDSLSAGSEHLAAHVAILRQFGVPVVVAVNRFPTDTDRELDLIRRLAGQAGADRVAVCSAFQDGSEGAQELAAAVVEACREPGRFEFLYPLDLSPEEKLECIATRVYGAGAIELHAEARQQIREFERLGHARLPVCIAKTQYSLSHDPKLLGRPRGFRFPIREVRLAAGAGFLLALSEGISLMPGLPREPAAMQIDVLPDGTVVGMR